MCISVEPFSRGKLAWYHLHSSSISFEVLRKCIKQFVAAAVRSHFDDCPDSHRHFCFHGTCQFLIMEETPACVCHQGFVGIRCEHADLLAVVATNHSQNTFATVLVFCVISCILLAVLYHRHLYIEYCSVKLFLRSTSCVHSDLERCHSLDICLSKFCMSDEKQS
uniref:EGF-like domain-containing protein n=1 Tax=Periophthalmus magnuspinnatus TaxID=409849 RepID=A0A3B4A6V5_9GOBI